MLTWNLKTIAFLAIFVLANALFRDYTQILQELHEAGLVSARVKRGIHAAPQLSGVTAGGCPLSKSRSVSRDKRSLDNQQSAHHVLAVMSDLTGQFGRGEADRRVKRAVRTDILCPRGWVLCHETYKYRYYDGTCNNLNYPTRGAAKIHQLRFVSPAYDDGEGLPRRLGKSGNCLPSAREITRKIHLNHTEDEMDMSSEFTQLQMVFGQFTDHDITLTPQGHIDLPCCNNGTVNANSMSSCAPNGSRGFFILRQTMNSIERGDDRNPQEVCMPILTSPDDPEYTNCIDFKRSLSVPSGECGLGHREQINDITAYLDGSNIYSSDRFENWHLRAKSGGRMEVSAGNKLPLCEHLRDECLITQDGERCFEAGDHRANEQPGLTALHTLFILEHNRIANLLLPQVPVELVLHGQQQVDEYVFQEARRIVVSQLQHITYTEYLPTLLNKQMLRKYRLKKKSRTRYSSLANPGIRNEFSTFAFRVGHTFIPKGIQPLQRNLTPYDGMFKFKDELLNPHLITHYGADSIVRFIINSEAKVPSSSVTNNLEKAFGGLNTSFSGGIDVPAANIQRGRDHGIPGYTVLRRYCKLSVPETFDELDMDVSVIDKLKELYEHVDDIDAWTGAISEKKMVKASLGPLNSCIIGRQFMYIKKADRFWYEFKQPNVGLTTAQIETIYQSSLASIMCKNLDIPLIQPDVFRLPNNITNVPVPCDSLTHPDYSHWL